MVTNNKDQNESNCLKKDEDLNETKVNVEENFFKANILSNHHRL